MSFCALPKTNTMQTTSPILKHGWLRVLLFLIAYLLLLFFSNSLLAVVSTALFSNADQLNLFYCSILLNFIISIAVVVVFRKTVDRNSIQTLGLQWKGFLKERVSGFFTAVLLTTAIATVLWLMQLLQWFVTEIDINGLLIVTVLLILVAIAEELVFRGYILHHLMNSFSKETALFISALLFAGFHSLNPNFNIIAFINIFIAGLLLGVNFIYTKNLWFAIFFHFSWNFFQGPVLGFQVSGIELPTLLQQNGRGSALLTGGAFGLEASWLTTICMSITVMILYFIFQAKYSSKTVE